MATLTAPRITRTTGRTGRFYDIPNDDGTTTRMPSVTTILGAINKPALLGWAAREEKLSCMEAAADLYAETATLNHQLPRAAYVLALDQRIGTTKAHIKTLAKAADIGSAAHSKIEWLLKREQGHLVGPEPQLVDEAEWAVMAFEDLKRATSLTPLAIEQVVFSRTHGFAGTLDLVATLNPQALLRILEGQGPVDPNLATWLHAQDQVTACVDFKTGRAVYPESFLQSCAYTRAFAEMGHGRVDGGLIFRLPKNVADPAFQVVVVPPARDLFPTFLATKTLWEWTYKNEQAYQAKRKVA